MLPRSSGSNAGVQPMTQRATFKRIGVDAARDLLKSDETIVIDVRDAGSYEKAHIDDARWVSERNLHEILSSTPKDKPILIYCYHGNASQTYANIFTDFGFQDVYSLDGGFEHWAQAQSRS